MTELEVNFPWSVFSNRFANTHRFRFHVFIGLHFQHIDVASAIRKITIFNRVFNTTEILLDGSINLKTVR